MQDGSERSDQHQLRITQAKGPLRRSRILPDIRRQIVDAVMGGRYTGVEAARAYAVSEATVHRLVKAERLASPERTISARSRAQSRSSARQLAKADPDFRGRRALTATQQQEVVERLYTGADIGADLAREFGVHKSTISRILRAAKAQFAYRSMVEPDPLLRQKRVVDRTARAIADGRRPGRKSKLSEDIQEAIVMESVEDGASFTKIAIKYGVSPPTISRIVGTRRVQTPPDNPQSLEEILSDLLEWQQNGVTLSCDG